VLESSVCRTFLRERVQQRTDPVCETTQDRIRERNRALESRFAHELDRFVHRCIARYSIDESKLIRAEPQRGAHRRIETGNASSAERLDCVVERSGPLNCPECQSLRERAIARV
jgi:hypothetical protein